jgi:hypothetical protein
VPLAAVETQDTVHGRSLSEGSIRSRAFIGRSPAERGRCRRGARHEAVIGS